MHAMVAHAGYGSNARDESNVCAMMGRRPCHIVSHMRGQGASMPIFQGEMPSSADLSADLLRRSDCPRILNIAWQLSKASVASGSILWCDYDEYANQDSTSVYALYRPTDYYCVDMIGHADNGLCNIQERSGSSHAVAN